MKYAPKVEQLILRSSAFKAELKNGPARVLVHLWLIISLDILKKKESVERSGLGQYSFRCH
jgi:hypothetical protein